MNKTHANIYKILCLPLITIVLFAFIVPVKDARAESLTLTRPLDSVVTSKFGWRKAENTGGNVSYDRLHAGTDYRAQTPTPVPYIGNYQGCSNGIATIANQCGVTQRFIHLSSCSPGNLVSGSTGTKAPHLHHELNINGTPVDGEVYFNGTCGGDLCTEAVRKCLLDDAQSKGSGSGGAGAASGSDAPAPPEQGGSSSVYVPTGGIDPVTLTPNTGRPYYVNIADGRISRELVYDDEETVIPALGPTTENVVPTTTTNNAVAGCATDTWTAMVNQAVLQTRREILTNNTYIAKGDSVMAYSCFQEGLKPVGEKLGPIFSETKLWVNKDIDISAEQNGSKLIKVNRELGENSLDGAIMNAAMYVYRNYAGASFRHSLLGGKLGSSGSGNFEDPANEDAGAQDALPCGTMNQIWQMAKCMTATDDSSFKTFSDLITPDSDPRKYPGNMSCNNTGITQNMIDIARQRDVKNSKIKSHLTILEPIGTLCAAPVYTGVTVERQRGAGILSSTVTYPDAVCVTQGCSYQNSGGRAGPLGQHAGKCVLTP